MNIFYSKTVDSLSILRKIVRFGEYEALSLTISLTYRSSPNALSLG